MVHEKKDHSDIPATEACFTKKIYLVTPSHGIEWFFDSKKNKDKKDIESPEQYFERFHKLTSDWGYQFIRPEGEIFGHPYFQWSGTPQMRANQLEQALRDRETYAIWAIDGGGGSDELILLLKEKHKKNSFLAKNIPFFGMSDGTPIGLYLESIGVVTHVQACSIFATQWTSLAEAFEPRTKRLEALRDFLDNPNLPVQYQLTPFNDAARQMPIDLHGKMVGGCTYSVVPSCGTSFEPEWEGNILYLEGLTQQGRIEDAIKHLKNAANITERISAIVIGDFSCAGSDTDNPERRIKELNDFAQELTVPLFTGVPQGHGGNGMPVPMGTKCIIKKNGLLIAEKRRALERCVSEVKSLTDSEIKQNRPPFLHVSQFGTEKVVPSIGTINEDQLVAFNQAAKTKHLESGEIVGYGKVGTDLPIYTESLCSNGFFQSDITNHFMIGSPEGHQYFLTKILLRGHLSNVKSIIFSSTQPMLQGLTEQLQEYVDRHLLNTPVYIYYGKEQLSEKVTGTLVARGVNITQENQSVLAREERENIVQNGISPRSNVFAENLKKLETATDRSL